MRVTTPARLSRPGSYRPAGRPRRNAHIHMPTAGDKARAGTLLARACWPRPLRHCAHATLWVRSSGSSPVSPSEFGAQAIRSASVQSVQ